MVSIIQYIKTVMVSNTTLESFKIRIQVLYSNCVLSVWRLQVVETTYSSQELANIHSVYGLADGNAVAARRLYQERYP
jgi:hypothetical protein